MDIIATTEGLFLSLDSQAQFLETSIIEPDMKNHFMIAELDNTAEILIHLINRNFAIQTKHICQLVKHQSFPKNSHE